ncbi:hypothetical protein [Gracilimonas sp.]|uniref:hypothetical protein n=1 Tax=Gracilimonas sp. TaxID=1974203 RepID=UPI003D0D48F9
MKNEASILKVRFKGEGISPGSFTAKELGELLIDLQKGMASIAEHFGDKDWVDSEKILSLVNVEDKSNGLSFASYYPAADSGYDLMIKSANNKNLYGLPRGAFDGMKAISKLTKKKRCSAELSFEQDSENSYAVITPDDNLITPEEVYMRDTKDFYGEIIRVGGVQPKVWFRTFGGTLQDGIISKEIAPKVASKLYKTVKMKAEIKWLASSSEIEEIKILDVEEFEIQSNTDLFDDLRDSLGDYSEKYGSDLKGLIND